MPAVGRKDLINDLITLMKNAVIGTYPHLAAIDDVAIEFGLRTFEDLFSVRRKKGIFVGPGDGTLQALTAAAVHKDVQQDVQVIVYTMGMSSQADEEEALAIYEEAEVLLWANKILSHGARIVDEGRMFWGPPVKGGELTIHWAVMTVHYELTATL